MKFTNIISLASVSTERSVRKGTTVRSVKTKTHAKAYQLAIKDIHETAERMYLVSANLKVTVPTNILSQKRIKNKIS